MLSDEVQAVVVETERLRLRAMTPADAPFILDLFTQPSFLQNIGDRGIHSVADADAYIVKGPMASYSQRGFGFYVTVLKSSGAAAGICGLIKRDGLGDVDLGFAFLPEFWSCGYATEAADAVLGTAAEHDLSTVLAIVRRDNVGSVRVLQKVGMQRSGTVRLPSDTIDLELYARHFEPSEAL